MIYETENLEFKRQVTDDLYKEIIAFANAEGGTVYIGIDDDGKIVGIDDIDDTYTRITNGIRDAIQPDVTMFIKYTLHENAIIQITVGEGSYKPYYLKSKGLKPSGVYIRQGTSSAQASPEQIRQMIKYSDGDVFESMRSLEQELTFQTASEVFSRYHLDFTEDKYIHLGLRDLHDDLYTNLAWLLSDQCRHTTKVAVFGDDSNTIFKDTKEFSGSIFKQLDDTFSYLTLCNRTISEFQGLIRIEKMDYPPNAVREALLNALVHRDYSFSGSIIININDSSMEFISIGGLLPGLSADDIKNGISQPRNRNLADIFHRLRLIESYGTGIRKIYNLYKDCLRQPQIEITPNTFKLVLPNMNAAGSSVSSQDPASSIKNASVKEPVITPQMQIVLDYLAEYEKITDLELQDLLNIRKTRAYTLSRQMYDAGLIDIIGRGSDKYYKRKE